MIKNIDKDELFTILKKVTAVTAIHAIILSVTVLISLSMPDSLSLVSLIILLIGIALCIVSAYIIAGFHKKYPSKAQHIESAAGYGAFAFIIIVTAFIIIRFITTDEKYLAKKYWSQAEEIIEYSEFDCGDMMKTPARKNSIMIDYTGKRISFIYKYGPHYEEVLFETFTLKQSDKMPYEYNDKNTSVQYCTPLSYPGRRLTFYCSSDHSWGKDKITLFAEIEMENNDKLYAIIDKNLGIEPLPDKTENGNNNKEQQ